MGTISIRFEDDFLHDMEKTMKNNRYSTKAEFIREAIREKMKDLEKEAALMRLEKVYGAGKKKGRKITDEMIHKAGDEAVKEIAKKLKVDLD